MQKKLPSNQRGCNVLLLYRKTTWIVADGAVTDGRVISASHVQQSAVRHGWLNLAQFKQLACSGRRTGSRTKNRRNFSTSDLRSPYANELGAAPHPQCLRASRCRVR
jgi:hypothetical protein